MSSTCRYGSTVIGRTLTIGQSVTTSWAHPSNVPIAHSGVPAVRRESPCAAKVESPCTVPGPGFCGLDALSVREPVEGGRTSNGLHAYTSTSASIKTLSSRFVQRDLVIGPGADKPIEEVWPSCRQHGMWCPFIVPVAMNVHERQDHPLSRCVTLIPDHTHTLSRNRSAKHSACTDTVAIVRDVYLHRRSRPTPTPEEATPAYPRGRTRTS